MSSQNLSHHAVASAEHNRLVARRWIDAFNERDDRRGLGPDSRLHRARA